jgi:hypothetical protein
LQHGAIPERSLLSVIALGAVILLIAAAGWYLRWLFQSSDEDESEETVWFDVREWNLLDRLFGPRTRSLTYKPTSTTEPEDPR